MNSFTTDLISTTGIMILAEFADKTNLVALSLMAKSQKPFTVAIGGMLGISIVTTVGVLIGVLIGDVLPLSLVPLFAGTIFIWIGISELKDDDHELEEEQISNSTRIIKKSDVLFNSMILIGLAEIGDKSQIFVITRAIDANPLGILLGAIIGMGIIMFATAYFGEVLIQKLPEEQIHKIASIGFILVGGLLVISWVWNLLS